MSEKPNLISLTIDGVPVDVDPGTTILEAAQTVGIDIPYLCHEERLRPFGACRICLVEVKGGRGPIPACTSPVAPNMEVTTSNENIDKLRKNVLELLLIHHPLDCPVCDKAGECTLQDLVYKYGPTSNRYLFNQERAASPIDNRSPFIERNNNRCVLCGACARICNEVQAVGEISFVNRGFNATVGTIFDQPLNCEFCGQCISACPVGALNNSIFRNQSRVWDLDVVSSTCGICGNGCAYKIETRDNKVYRVTHDTKQGTNNGALCGKGRFGFGYLSNIDRLTDPLIKKDGKFEKATWDEALDHVAKKLSDILQADGPSAVGVLGSPHGTNEDAKALKLLFADLLRVKNIDSQARYFLAPTLEILGHQTGGVNDISEADLLIVVDSATTNSQPVLGNRIIKRHRMDEVPLVVIDPRRTKQARYADIWLGAKPGSSAEVLAGIANNAGVLNAAEFNAATAKNIKAVSGIENSEIEKAAALLKKAKKPVIFLGTWPYAEELNAKNARMVYALAKATGAKVVVPAEKANLRGLLKYGVSPVDDGLDATEMIEQSGQVIKAMYICGDNPVANFPLGEEVGNNLSKLDFLVVSELFMTDTAKLADVVLPATGVGEKTGTLTNYEGLENTINKAVNGPGQARADMDILLDLTGRMRHDITLDDILSVTFEQKWSEPKLPELTFKSNDAPKNYPFILLSGPVLFHCGTLTTYSEELTKVFGKTDVLINPADAKMLGVLNGDNVNVESTSGKAEAEVHISADLNKGAVFLPNHFPQAGVNNLFGAAEGGEMVFVKIEKA